MNMRKMRWLLGVVAALVGLSGPAGAARADLITNSPNLPPLAGQYVSPALAHQLYQMGALTIEVINIKHHGFSNSFPPPQNVGGMGADNFSSELDGDLVVNGGSPMPFMATSQVTVDVTKTSGPNGSPLGTFATQMVQLDVSGLPMGALIRVDPTTPSTGQTTITPAGGGLFHITSFFDIFTDLSLDGGQTWTPATGPGHVDLVSGVPEPSTFALLGLGGLGLLGYGWRRRQTV